MKPSLLEVSLSSANIVSDTERFDNGRDNGIVQTSVKKPTRNCKYCFFNTPDGCGLCSGACINDPKRPRFMAPEDIVY